MERETSKLSDKPDNSLECKQDHQSEAKETNGTAEVDNWS